MTAGLPRSRNRRERSHSTPSRESVAVLETVAVEGFASGEVMTATPTFASDALHRAPSRRRGGTRQPSAGPFVLNLCSSTDADGACADRSAGAQALHVLRESALRGRPRALSSAHGLFRDARRGRGVAQRRARFTRVPGPARHWAASCASEPPPRPPLRHSMPPVPSSASPAARAGAAAARAGRAHPPRPTIPVLVSVLQAARACTPPPRRSRARYPRRRRCARRGTGCFDAAQGAACRCSAHAHPRRRAKPAAAACATAGEREERGRRSCTQAAAAPPD